MPLAKWLSGPRRQSQQHKHGGLINRLQAFSTAKLAANAFLIFQSLIEVESDSTKSFICLFTNNSFALIRLFPLITTSHKRAKVFSYITFKFICELGFVGSESAAASLIKVVF